MKKVLIFVFLMCFTSLANAQDRGPLPNIFASFVSVSANSSSTITFPANSRDIYIINDSGQKICLAPGGGTINLNTSGYCVNASNGRQIFQMATGTQLALYDFITDSLTIRNTGVAAASPVSVVVTY